MSGSRGAQDWRRSFPWTRPTSPSRRLPTTGWCAPLETAAPAATGAALPRIGLALVTDANIFANAASLPVVCCGPEYATAHSDHERVSVERLHQTAALYALAAMEFCGVEG